MTYAVDVYNRQLEMIRKLHTNPATVRYIHHFEAMVGFLECCLEESPSWFDEELMNTLREIATDCPSVQNEPDLGYSLAWILDCRWGGPLRLTRKYTRFKREREHQK